MLLAACYRHRHLGQDLQERGSAERESVNTGGTDPFANVVASIDDVIDGARSLALSASIDTKRLVNCLHLIATSTALIQEAAAERGGTYSSHFCSVPNVRSLVPLSPTSLIFDRTKHTRYPMNNPNHGTLVAWPPAR